jgi:hypothetical protein
VPDWTCGSFAGYARRTAASKERNAGRGAIWQHLPVIYPCHLPMLVFWPGPCSSHACGVDGRRTSRRQQHRCEALDTVCLTSQAGMMYGLQVMDQVDISVDARASHATPRCEARRGAFQRPSIVVPGNTTQPHTRGQVVYGRVHFSDELPLLSGSRPRTSPDPGRCGLS